MYPHGTLEVRDPPHPVIYSLFVQTVILAISIPFCSGFPCLSCAASSHYYPLSINLENLISGWMMLLTKGIPPLSGDLHLTPPPLGEHTHFSPLSAFVITFQLFRCCFGSNCSRRLSLLSATFNKVYLAKSFVSSLSTCTNLCLVRGRVLCARSRGRANIFMKLIEFERSSRLKWNFVAA